MSYPPWHYPEDHYPFHVPNFSVPPLPIIHPPDLALSPDTSYPATPLLEIEPNFGSILQPPPAPLPPPTRRKAAKAKSRARSQPLSVVSTNTSYPNHPASPEDNAIPLKGFSGTLLPAPTGAILEVNGLLLLRPPSLPIKLTKQSAINQYDRENITTPGTHQSQYEQYTCRVCRKTYDGKNARSVARRHLQDKHGVPLAVQERRTRWDTEPDRPKSTFEARERTLKAKRDWASKNRLQNRLESTHADYLAMFGPQGLLTPCGYRLVAPTFRHATLASLDGQVFHDGTLGLQGRLVLPEGILEGVKAIREVEAQAASQPIYVPEPEDAIPRVRIRGKARGTVQGKGKGKKKRRRSTSTTASVSPIREVRAAANRTPVSHARTGQFPEGEEELDDDHEEAQEWLSQWNAATALQAAVEDAGQAGASGCGQLEPVEQPEVPVVDNDDDAESQASSEIVETIEVRNPAQEWVLPSSVETWDHTQPYINQDGVWVWPKDPSDPSPATTVLNLEAEEEAVAAESLLNLHSTPLRPPPPGTESEPEPEREPSRPAQPILTEQLLAAPVLSTKPRRPQPLRARPSERIRPEAFRSLSFDDPFELSPLPPMHAGRKGKDTPSPLQLKRKTAPSPSPIQPLRPRPDNHTFTTPLRRAPLHIPSSVWRDSIVCSPNAEMVASLGLAPSAPIVTPGGVVFP